MPDITSACAQVFVNAPRVHAGQGVHVGQMVPVKISVLQIGREY
ncbi:MAG: hypothetical protein M0Z39_09855 [Actinomycetota bacterium]|nr:hypothetical protein [Actinomycetota bacterium]